MRHFFLAILLSRFCLSASSLLAQPVLTVTFQQTNLAFTAAQFTALPHTNLTLLDPHEKKEHQFSVVSVRDLLSQAGVPLGAELRGPALREVVMVRCHDNYAVAFTLADFDDAYSTQTIVLADQEDENPLSNTAGPLRLIVTGDKKAARWARMVTKIEVFNPDEK